MAWKSTATLLEVRNGFATYTVTLLRDNVEVKKFNAQPVALKVVVTDAEGKASTAKVTQDDLTKALSAEVTAEIAAIESADEDRTISADLPKALDIL